MQYKSLFNLKVLHYYFLNNGTDLFSALDTEAKNKILQSYDVSEFLKIVPTDATRKFINNRRLKLITTKQGISVFASTEDGVDPLIDLNNNGIPFRFALYAEDSYFDSFTKIKASRSNNRLYEFLSTGVLTEEVTLDDTIFLAEGDARSLMHTIAIENALIELNSIANIDVADIATTESIEMINKVIKSEKQKGLIGYFTIPITEFMAEPAAPVPYDPAYTIIIENRSMDWNYFKNGTSLSTENNKPIVKNGVVVTGKSNPQPKDIKSIDLVTYYAEINI